MTHLARIRAQNIAECRKTLLRQGMSNELRGANDDVVKAGSGVGVGYVTRARAIFLQMAENIEGIAVLLRLLRLATSCYAMFRVAASRFATSATSVYVRRSNVARS